MKIAIIGGGPGGYIAAIRAAQLGAEVSIIEKEHLGGTCLNVGCIPTKVLLHTANLVDTLKKEAKELAIEVTGIEADWSKLQKRKNKITKKLIGGIEGILKSHQIIKYIGQATFSDKNEVTVKCSNGKIEKVAFDYAIIATGSEPNVIPIPGIELQGVITSNEALSLEEVPESLLIIGGGVIGCEFASIYNSFECKVRVIETLPRIVANMDAEITNVLQNKLVKYGIEIHTNTKVKKIEKTADGLEIHTLKGEKSEVFKAEKVLLSIGRKPVTEGLGLDKIGVKTKGSAVAVNDKFQTNVRNIYAIGDCNGGVMLAHVASAQGISAVERIMKKKTSIDFKTTPYCVYTRPELASAGLTEEQAIEQGYHIEKGVFPLFANGKSMITCETEGIVKYISDKATGEILGLHIAGPRATDLIVEGALAIRLEATVEEIITTIHAHPTVGECLHEAAHGVHNNALHLPKIK
ncbi:dihydrolipoyl dehydrogenase [Alkalibaculum bacchi]|uniref:dihydrolipoyl dehydrogenase n=1 Tax=Alkalibaculum bacchi TaxID=645887 RepID=UPI0026EA2E4D|nr:dihydrolipoyl dehydrogenase [Alkalibaculum bacchi]